MGTCAIYSSGPGGARQLEFVLEVEFYLFIILFIYYLAFIYLLST